MPGKLAYVAIGAIFGAIARFAATHFSSELSQHHGFPYGTLFVNAIGSVIVGYVLTWTTGQNSDTYRLLLATGFCGAFTTFSAFAYESMAYWHAGQFGMFALNVTANNLLSLLGVACGIKLHELTGTILHRF